MNTSLTDTVSVEIICEAIANREQCSGLEYQELVRFVSSDIVVIDYLWDVWQIDIFELF